MKRWAFRILVFLLLGTIVNVAVAWGCSGIGPLPQSGDPLGRWSVHTQADLAWLERRGWKPMTGAWKGDVHHQSLRSSTVEYGLYSEIGIPTAGRFIGVLPQWTFAVWVRAGWPMQSLSGERFDRRALSRNSIPSVPGFSIGLAPPAIADQDCEEVWAVPARFNVMSRADRARVLPLRPIWPGFAINTVFYAAILWMLFAAPFALRRRLRIKRGLCPACGYDLRGSGASVCPECGKAANA